MRIRHEEVIIIQNLEGAVLSKICVLRLQLHLLFRYTESRDTRRLVQWLIESLQRDNLFSIYNIINSYYNKQVYIEKKKNIPDCFTKRVPLVNWLSPLINWPSPREWCNFLNYVYNAYSRKWTQENIYRFNPVESNQRNQLLTIIIQFLQHEWSKGTQKLPIALWWHLLLQAQAFEYTEKWRPYYHQQWLICSHYKIINFGFYVPHLLPFLLKMLFRYSF